MFRERLVSPASRQTRRRVSGTGLLKGVNFRATAGETGGLVPGHTRAGPGQEDPSVGADQTPLTLLPLSNDPQKGETSLTRQRELASA